MEHNDAREMEMPSVTTMSPQMKLWTSNHRDACRFDGHLWDISQAHGCYNTPQAACCTDPVVDGGYPYNDREAPDHDDELGAFDCGGRNEVAGARSFDLLD